MAKSLRKWLFNKVQFLLGVMDPLLPPFIKRFFYLMPFYLFRFFNEKNDMRIWYRNSLAFNDLVFGHSDIDLTLFGGKGVTFSQGQSVQKSLGRWRFIFPHLGELAIYEKDSFKEFVSFANPLELGRDPLLVKTLALEERLQKVSEAERQAFALNWLRNDYHKWSTSFFSRRKKIKRFLTFLDIPYPSFELHSSEELLTHLKEYCWSGIIREAVDFNDFTEKFLKLPLQNNNKESALNAFYHEEPELRLTFMCCYPQLWLGPALVHKMAHEDIQHLNCLPQGLQELFRSQLRWEIWGLYTQWMREGGNLNFYIHIDKLSELLMAQPSGESQGWQEELRALSRMKESDPSLSTEFSSEEVHYASH